MSKVLKPCPFCGHKKVKAKNEEGQHWVQCQKCFAEGPPLCKRSEEDAPDWNTRAQPIVSGLVPDGYKLVPIVPNHSMVMAGAEKIDAAFTLNSAAAVYRAMLAASPSAKGGE
jgi:hypothetical protein